MSQIHLPLWDMLVWAYARQMVDCMSGRSLFGLEAAVDGESEPHGHSADGVAKIQAIGALGCAIDGGGGAWGGSTECHPDAERLHDLVLLGNPVDVSYIVHAARRQDRPSLWDGPNPVAYPKVPPPRIGDGARWAEMAKLEGRGVFAGEEIVYAMEVVEWVEVRVPKGAGRKGLQRWKTERQPVLVCPIEWDPSPIWIAARNEMVVWFDAALDRLRRRLAGTAFRDHVLTDLPTREPANDSEINPDVLTDLRARKAR